MDKKETIFYKGYKLQFWGGSWDIFDKNYNYVIKCFRFLEDAKDYINKLEENVNGNN